MKKTFNILFVILVSALTACGGGGSDSDDSGSGLSNNACGAIGLPTRIVDGTSCGNLTASAVVRFIFVDAQGNTGFCTGTMLTADDVLTAAHCVPNGLNGLTSAVVASGNTLASSVAVDVRRVSVHPGYVPVGEASPIAAFNDVAILHLASPLNIPTLPIVTSQQVVVGDIISIFGYGTDENGRFNGEDLQSGEMLVSDVDANHIAANFTGDGSNTCQGDSGGPAILSTAKGPGIVGTTSTGTSLTCSPPDLSLFANVQHPNALNFIRQSVPDARLL